jgi:hypothetical protein
MLPALALAALAPAFALAAPAAAACPAALGAGIIVTASDGGTARISPTETPGMYDERTTFDDVPGYAMLSWWGVYAVATLDFDGVDAYPDSGETVAFVAPPPRPEPGQRIEGLLAMVDRIGLPMPRRHDLQAGALADVVIGECRYDGFPVELTVADDDGARVLSLVFLPAFDLALFVGYSDAAGGERYELLTVAPLPGAGE